MLAARAGNCDELLPPPYEMCWSRCASGLETLLTVGFLWPAQYRCHSCAELLRMNGMHMIGFSFLHTFLCTKPPLRHSTETGPWMWQSKPLTCYMMQKDETRGGLVHKWLCHHRKALSSVHGAMQDVPNSHLAEGSHHKDGLCRLCFGAQRPQHSAHFRAEALVKHGVCLIKHHILHIAPI